MGKTQLTGILSNIVILDINDNVTLPFDLTVSGLAGTGGVVVADTLGLLSISTNYYTKTELQTSGSSTVHWDNITNTPQFIPDGDKGDITVSSGGLVWTIDPAAVTYSKIQNVGANSFLANTTGASATVQEIATNRIPLFSSAITGVPGSSTYLRGDGAWETVPFPTSAGPTFSVQLNGGAGTFYGSDTLVYSEEVNPTSEFDPGNNYLTLKNVFSGGTAYVAGQSEYSAFLLTMPSSLSYGGGIVMLSKNLTLDIASSGYLNNARKIQENIFAGGVVITPQHGTGLFADDSSTGNLTYIDLSVKEGIVRLGHTAIGANPDDYQVYVSRNDIKIDSLKTGETPPTTTGLTRVVITDSQGKLSFSSTALVGLTDGDKGDITVSDSGATWTIDNSAVTLAKIQNIAANTFLANVTGSPAVVQEISTGRIPLFSSNITGTPNATSYLRGDGSWATLSTGVSLSSITAAVATNTINNSNFSQQWNWISQNSGTSFSIASTGNTSIFADNTTLLVGNSAINTSGNSQNITASFINSGETNGGSTQKIGISVSVSGTNTATGGTSRGINISAASGRFTYGISATAMGVSNLSTNSVGVSGGGSNAISNIGVFGSAFNSSGASTNYGIYSSASGTLTSTNYGFYSVINSGSLNSYGIYLSVSNATNTYSIYTELGNVRIGTLIGTGTRMVVADSNGILSTQAIPSGGGGGFTVTNETDNRIITSSGTGTGNAEANLIFDGSALALTGGMTISGSLLIQSLSGTETRMVVVGTDGTLSAQAIPSGGSAVNIYNSDGTLTGNRTLTTGTNSLTFQSTTSGVTSTIFQVLNLVGENGLRVRNDATVRLSSSTEVNSAGIFFDAGKSLGGFSPDFSKLGYWEVTNAGISNRGQGDFIWNSWANFPLMTLKQNGNLLVGGFTDNGFVLDVTGTTRLTGNLTIDPASDWYWYHSDIASSIILGIESSFAYMFYNMGARNLDFATNSSGSVRFRNTGNFSIEGLSGVGTRMVTVTAAGVLGSQAIPSGGGTVTETTQVVVKMGLPALFLGNSITGHEFYVRNTCDYLNTTTKTVYYDAGTSTRGNIKRINQDNILGINREFTASWMNGINDIRFNNSTTNYKWRHVEHVREFLVNAFAQSIETAAEAQIAGRTYVGVGGGSWTTWGQGLINNGRSQGLKGTGDVAIDFLIPPGVESVAIVFFTNFPGEVTETLSTSIRIEVEGQFVENINLSQRSTGGGFDHYTYHVPRTYFETSGGSQVRAINLDTSRSMIVDYGVALRNSKDCPAVIVWDNSYVADELMVPGYNEFGNIVPTGIDRAWFDECDQAVRDMIDKDFIFFGYPVIKVKTNTFFEPSNYIYTPGWTDLSSATQWDGLHPNYKGHQEIFKALIPASLIIKDNSATGGGGSYTFSQGLTNTSGAVTLGGNVTDDLFINGPGSLDISLAAVGLNGLITISLSSSFYYSNSGAIHRFSVDQTIGSEKYIDYDATGFTFYNSNLILPSLAVAGQTRKLVIDEDGVVSSVLDSGGGDITDAANLGTGQGIYASKSGSIINLKSLKQGTNITLNSTGTEITINASASGIITADKITLGTATFWSPAYQIGAYNASGIVRVGSGSDNTLRIINIAAVLYVTQANFTANSWVQCGLINDPDYRPTHTIYWRGPISIDGTKYTNASNTAFTGSNTYADMQLRIDSNGQVFVSISSVSTYAQLSGGNIVIVPINISYHRNPNILT
jgi:hypothetical protein